MWSEAMLDILKAAGYCAVAWLLVPFIWSVFRWTIVNPAAVLHRKLKSLPPVPRVLAVLVLCVSIVFGDKPSTNGTDSADAPLLGGARMTMRSAQPRPSSVRRLCVPSLPFSEIDEDAVANGWRVSSVVTNENVTIVPESAARCERWHRTGGASKFDFFKLQDWFFPFGTNLYDTVTAFNDGSLAIDFGPGCPRLAATPDPVYPVPFSSEFLTWGDARAMTFLWKDYSLCATDATARVDVRIDLHADGDFVVSTNCVSWLCRRIEQFDWDGDGLPNDADLDPYVSDGDCFGPHQVLPSGADTNAYYRVDVVSPFEDALVTFIGDAPSNLPDPRFVAKAGETNRVVLLIGKYYSVESTRPLVITDKSDVEIEVGTLNGSPVSACYPVSIDVQGTDGGGFSVNVSPMRLCGDFVWSNACCVVTGSAGFFSFGCDANCSCGGCLADGCFLYEGYSIFLCELSCGCHPYDGDDDVGDASCEISLPIPNTIFVDDDDDDDDGEGDYGADSPLNDDVWEGHLRLELDEASTGTVRIVGLSCPGCDVYCGEGEDKTGLEAGMSWPVVGRRFWSVPVRVSAVSTSSGFENCRIAVRWIPAAGAPRTKSVRFTAVRPVAEPVCTNWTVVAGVGSGRCLENPCGIGVGEESVFRIGVRPVSYPDEMIVWHADGAGSVEFVGGGTGRVVRVRGVAPGDVELSAQIGDCSASRPRFFARVVTNMTVKLSAWIVSDKDGTLPFSIEEVRELIRQANDIYRQVGVTLDIGDRISITNIPQAYVINRHNEMTNRWNCARLVNTHSNTGGLECYFVGDIIKDGTNKSYSVAGVHSPSGLVVSASCGDGVVLAHEIGHAFGMRDIYDEDQATQAGVMGRACWFGSPSDWNGGCECTTGTSGAERYYPSGTLQCDIISRMLMNGASEEGASGADITCGPVRGYDVDGELGLVGTGFFSGSQRVASEHE